MLVCRVPGSITHQLRVQPHSTPPSSMRCTGTHEFHGSVAQQKQQKHIVCECAVSSSSPFSPATQHAGRMERRTNQTSTLCSKRRHSAAAACMQRCTGRHASRGPWLSRLLVCWLLVMLGHGGGLVLAQVPGAQPVATLPAGGSFHHYACK